MKTILVPTDFSPAAYNAIEYAAEIAKRSNARLVLFHVYNIPVMPAEAPLAMPIQEIEESAMHDLRKIKERIVSRHPGDVMLIEYECRVGFPVHEISNFAEECGADLIVMGMEGSDALTEKLIGSITTALMKDSKCPVLAIGTRVKFRSIKKIALACDYTHMDMHRTLAPLKQLAQLLKSDVYVLNVVSDMKELPTISKTIEGIKLDHALEGVNHSFHYTENKSVLQGINHFVELQNIDMVAMVPHRHGFFEKLFREPNTKQMAFHTDIPLLVLHEQQKKAGDNELLTTPENENNDQRH